jgi:hypothetical protein
LLGSIFLIIKKIKLKHRKSCDFYVVRAEVMSNSSLCRGLQPSVTSSLLGQNIPLITPLSNKPNLFPSLRARNPGFASVKF